MLGSEKKKSVYLKMSKSLLTWFWFVPKESVQLRGKRLGKHPHIFIWVWRPGQVTWRAGHVTAKLNVQRKKSESQNMASSLQSFHHIIIYKTFTNIMSFGPYFWCPYLVKKNRHVLFFISFVITLISWSKPSRNVSNLNLTTYPVFSFLFVFSMCLY